MAANNQQQAFLYMPDISGFTKFINETEIEHSAHIIQELLEIIIDSNQLGLQLMEIEGDAVFFYRFGKMPSVKEIIEQSKNIFTNFHQHLMKYDTHRICQCGACRTASELTLKFVVHYGNVSSINVGSNFKLIGKEVIVLHRLMKNKVPFDEYVLLTEPFWNISNDEYLTIGKFEINAETEIFDDNLITYKYIRTSEWLNEIEFVDSPVLNKHAAMRSAVISNININKPVDAVFNYIADLGKRSEWMTMIKNTEIITGERLNQTGIVHKCIIGNNSTVLFETDYFEHIDDSYRIIETDSKKQNFAHEFSAIKLSDHSCNVQIQFLLKDNFIHRLMFNLMMKKKILKGFNQSLINLQNKFENEQAVSSS